jgi:hypothetical protein
MEEKYTTISSERGSKFLEVSPREPRSQHSSVGIVMGYRLDDQGFILGRGKIFFSTPVSRMALGPTQPNIQ